ncbi:paraquat-inducible protein A [Piscinibacter sp.]|uniref:paraquat-inducible protein A n=1 Tax=Piscinibacter sp. TaxID=1903157 RepID=UPI002BF7FFE3|nr:paraquat-inducible protein A [Albitalea sp.]HUG25120.1 paraquat-inducible protein A [Albitalea sp.]
MSRVETPAGAVELLGCECCGVVSAASPAALAQPVRLRCPRCGHTVHPRRPLSLQRTWAYLAASVLLYVPANALPIMTTVDLFERSAHTIAGGIAELWGDEAYGLAAIVFVASIVVPLLKIAALALLAWTVPRAPGWRRLERARLYRVVETVGHWSMLDVYVVVLLGGMVSFGRIASAEPEPGLLAFAGVVVLTVLAARSFDPRLIWQEPDGDD